ncbi:MAG: CotH kinase family protein [Bacteroidetes bacterium]|nr:CotH kinase family protein [Bacteroidota bacterium]
MIDADKYFDLSHYTDYIIAESWMGNTDWPGNNIKIYRSNKTNYRWRFALIDLELSLNPNGWTTCFYNHIRYMEDQSTDNPYINIWLQSIQMKLI